MNGEINEMDLVITNERASRGGDHGRSSTHVRPTRVNAFCVEHA